ncbi:hypothetical protein C5167_022771 [Papaver somniferum]|uniref:Uncharacterized protein n=1 Tax=Papaver somniferum TaxID=3469 RepID=A0A4Y7JMQ6_PAPSO|nr:hypothetical protein C5167_022771 [Papaver somniferum]
MGVVFIVVLVILWSLPAGSGSRCKGRVNINTSHFNVLFSLGSVVNEDFRSADSDEFCGLLDDEEDTNALDQREDLRLIQGESDLCKMFPRRKTNTPCTARASSGTDGFT